MQFAEYSSTIDPSHIIHLIRQLLPSVNNTAAPSVPLPEGPPNGKEACAQERLELPPESCGLVSEETEEPATEPVLDESKGCCAHEDSDGKDVQERDNAGEDLGGVESGKEGADPKLGSCGLCEQEELREEAGCVLWDLAANESQAEFLVRSFMSHCCVQGYRHSQIP